MDFTVIQCLLAFMPPAATDGTRANSTGELLKIVPMFLFMFLVMYFLMIRPQQKKAKEHAQLVKSLKSGDKVLTSGGIVGVVVSVKERTVGIRSEGTKLEVVKSAVSEVLERAGSEAKAN